MESDEIEEMEEAGPDVTIVESKRESIVSQCIKLQYYCSIIADVDNDTDIGSNYCTEKCRLQKFNTVQCYFGPFSFSRYHTSAFTNSP